jgi:hypothetical protein
MVAVINKSTTVADEELRAMVDACDEQMSEFCRDWDLRKWNVRVGGDGYVKVVVVDKDTDVPDALAYHDLQDGRPVGIVMAKTVLDTGATVLGPGGVSVALSHELLETRADPYCNYDAGNWLDGFDYWLEVCDAVQAGDYAINGVHVSNYCRKSWFNPQAEQLASKQDPPYDRLGVLSKPFTIADGGYQVRNRPGEEAQVWGSAPPFHGWRSLERIKQAARLAR